MKRTMFLLLIVASISAKAQYDSVTIKVVFPFEATNVMLDGWSPWSQSTMEQTGLKEFSKRVPRENSYCFYIKYDVPEFDLYSIFIAGGETFEYPKIPERFDSHGIKYTKVYIDNRLINSLYTVLNEQSNGMNICFKKEGNSITPWNDSEHVPLFHDDRIPSEVHHHNSYLNTFVPGPNDINVVGWAVALSDREIADSCKMEIDYIRIFGRLGTNLILLESQEYNAYDPGNDGGLYMRHPFFPEGYDEHDTMPGELSGGVLTLNVYQRPDKVWHWWTPRFYAASFSYDSYRVECRVRTTGHAVIQVGIDFRNAQDSVSELGVSDWAFENNGEWQTVVFDSEDFLTSVPEHIVPQNSIEISCSQQMLTIKNKSMALGNYTLELISVDGKVIHNAAIQLNEEITSMPVSISCEKQILLYRIYSPLNKYSGKVTLY